MVMCAFSRQSPWLPGVLIMAHYVICADIVFNRPAPVAMVTWMGQWFRGAGVSQLAAVSYAVCLLVTYLMLWSAVRREVRCNRLALVCVCVCVCVWLCVCVCVVVHSCSQCKAINIKARLVTCTAFYSCLRTVTLTNLKNSVCSDSSVCSEVLFWKCIPQYFGVLWCRMWIW